MSETVIYTKSEGVASIRINRPEKYNSINQPTAYAIQKALDDAESDDSIRAIYLTGTGKAFCAGQDLGEIVDPNGPILSDIVTKHYNPIITRIRAIEKPIVAAVNGVAAGAGANIALAGDIVVAKQSATFIQAFSKIGLIPDSGGTYTLPRLIGMQRASALMMLGDKVGAGEAMQMGMIYRVFADEDFDEEAMKITKMLSLMPTKALARTKQLLNASYHNSIADQLALEGKYQEELSHSEDYEEGVAAFLEKRKPSFKGK